MDLPAPTDATLRLASAREAPKRRAALEPPTSLSDPAWEEWRLYAFRVCRACCWPQADADDLAQEVTSRAIRSFETPRKFRQWFNAIIRNVASEERKRRRSMSAKHQRAEECGVLASETIDPTGDLTTHDAWNQLAARDRAILRLVHVEGHSLREAGDLLDLSHSGARKRLKSAERALSAILSRD